MKAHTRPLFLTIATIAGAVVLSLLLAVAALAQPPQTVEQVVLQAERTYAALGVSAAPDMTRHRESRWHAPPPGEMGSWRAWLEVNYPGGYRAWNNAYNHTCHPTTSALSAIADRSDLLRPWVGDDRLNLLTDPCPLLAAYSRATSGAGVCPPLPLVRSCGWYRAALSGGGIHGGCSDAGVLAAVEALCGNRPGDPEEPVDPVDPVDPDGPDDPVDPPPTECVCDLTPVNTQIDLLSEAVSEAAEGLEALRRAHDLRLDELERAVEELRREPDPPPEDDPPPVVCQPPAEREAALEAWALRNRNPAMVAGGWSGERTLQVIRAQPPDNWHRSLLTAYEATLPPVCEGGEGEDQSKDAAEIAWPEIPNHHAETTERYRLHAWAIHGVLPPHVAMSSKRAANTPNQRSLRAADRYLATGEADDLLVELATRHAAIMAAEQGDYRLYHPEAALVAALAAQARGGDKVEAEAKAWLASYCAYADLMSVGGVSRIPGPRLGAAYGKDGWRDETCRILSGKSPPRGGEWSILDSDAARHLAGRLRGQVTWSRSDLPGVLSPLTVEVRQRGVVAKVQEYTKAAGGPVWAVGADTAGNEVMVSWRDTSATAWKCGRASPPGCVPANRWGGGRPLKAPVELDTSPLNLGPVVEVWRLDTNGARRLQ